jgi:integrase
MATHKINFNKRAISALNPPDIGRDTYHDLKTPGLELRITATGTMTFAYRRKINGRAIRVTIGKFPATTVEQAQKQAGDLNADIVKGHNPAEQKRNKRQEMTFGDLMSLYIERHAKMHKKTWNADQKMYDLHLAKWSNRKLSEITKPSIQRLHAKIGTTAPYAANRVLALLQTMFNRAQDWGFEKPNPARGIKKFKEKSRERFLESDELPRFFKALAAEPNHTARDYFLISLLTGARRANCLSMKWDDINFERGTWFITETKNGTAQTIPLVDQALQILRDRQSADDKDETWVFPGKGKTGHLVEPKTAWKRILTRAKINNMRIHDLRRSLGSWQAATGANLSIIGKTLNHKQVTTTAIYARLNIDPVRESMNIATDAMLRAGQQSDQA